MTQQQDYMIQLKDMNKWYGEFHVLKKHQLKCKERRKNRYLWPFRFREIDHDSLYQSP